MIERGPWYYFVPPMQDYVPERPKLGHICNAHCYYKWADTQAKPNTLLQIMLDEDEEAKKAANG